MDISEKFFLLPAEIHLVPFDCFSLLSRQNRSWNCPKSFVRLFLKKILKKKKRSFSLLVCNYSFLKSFMFSKVWCFRVRDYSRPPQKMYHRQDKAGQWPNEPLNKVIGKEIRGGQGQDTTFYPLHSLRHLSRLHWSRPSPTSSICTKQPEPTSAWTVLMRKAAKQRRRPFSARPLCSATGNTQHCLCWLFDTKATAKLMAVLLKGIWTLIMKRGTQLRKAH